VLRFKKSTGVVSGKTGSEKENFTSPVRGTFDTVKLFP